MEQMNKKIAKIVFNTLEKEVSDLIVLLTKEEKRSVKFFNNKITKTEYSTNLEMNVFFAKDKRVMFSQIPTQNINEAKRFCKKLVSISKVLPQKEDYYGIAEDGFNYKKLSNFDKNIAEGEGLENVENAINLASDKGRASGILSLKAIYLYLISSGGCEAEEKSTKYYFSFRFIKKDYFSAHKAACGAFLKYLNTEKIAKETIELTNLTNRILKFRGGNYFTIFEPLSFSSFASNFASSASIFDVEAGFSFLKEKLKQTVASKEISIIDDPLLVNGYNSRSFDDEGVATKRKYIVKNGILDTFLFNTSYARKYNTKTTANAGLIEPLPFNLVVKGENEKRKEKIIEEINEGIWITNNWYTRFNNYSTGDFSTLPRDMIFYIKNGEVKGALKQLRISDNLLRMFLNIRSISKEKEQVRWWDSPLPVVSPTVGIDKVHFTSVK
jgi:PmbA protein